MSIHHDYIAEVVRRPTSEIECNQDLETVLDHSSHEVEASR